MKQHIKTIPCQNHFENTSRTSPFLVVKYTLDYNSDIDDRELIDCLIEEAEAQARRVNPHAANSTSNQRSSFRVFLESVLKSKQRNSLFNFF